MQHFSFNQHPVNLVALDETLRDALGESYIGVSRTPQQVHVYLQVDAPPEHESLVTRIIKEHDPNTPTLRQKIQQQRQQALAVARDERGLELDMTDYDFADGIIRQLARKVAWLELELLTMREESAS